MWESPEGGRIILDPVRLPTILRNAKGGRAGFANGVLTPEHLVVSTVSCSSHHECAGGAGIDLVDIDWLDPIPGQGHIRLQFYETTVEAEFWYGEDVYECPVPPEQLAKVADWIAGHPAIVRAFGRLAPQVEIALMCDGFRMWTWKDGTIHQNADISEPAAPVP